MSSVEESIFTDSAVACIPNEEIASFYTTLYGNVFIFGALMCAFEVTRLFKSIQLCRLKRRFIATGRVPPKPSPAPLGWLWEINKVSDEDFLSMVGMDAYMFMRYIVLCLRLCCFWTVVGCSVLLPIYSIHGDNCTDRWNRFTVGNLSETKSQYIWAPVVMMYIFCSYTCSLLYVEYNNFLSKKLRYLVKGDTDIHPQAYYTCMVEDIPSEMRSVPLLRTFFEGKFPGRVYSVEFAIALEDLEVAAEYRRRVRDGLEKCIALFRSSTRRPIMWVDRKDVEAINASWAQRCAQNYLDASRVDPNAPHDTDVDSVFSSSRRTSNASLSDLGRPKSFMEHITHTISRLRSNSEMDADAGDSEQGSEKLSALRSSAALAKNTASLSNRVSGAGESAKVKPVNRDAWRFSGGLVHYYLCCCSDDYVPVDSIDYYTYLLQDLNLAVGNVQKEYLERASRLHNEKDSVRGVLENVATSAIIFVGDKIVQQAGRVPQNRNSEEEVFNNSGLRHRRASSVVKKTVVLGDVEEEEEHDDDDQRGFTTSQKRQYRDRLPRTVEEDGTSPDARAAHRSALSAVFEEGKGGDRDEGAEAGKEKEKEGDKEETGEVDGNDSDYDSDDWVEEVVRANADSTEVVEEESLWTWATDKLVKSLGIGTVLNLAPGSKPKDAASMNALSTIMEGARMLDLLAFGSVYRTSSTAFVTFKDRVAKSTAHQTLLSHEHFRMKVASAPAPGDVIWSNVAIPTAQINYRRGLVEKLLMVGAFFWSLITGSIASVSNLDAMAEKYDWIKSYQETWAYSILNDYLAVLLLLILLNVLPFIFQFLSQEYEGVKLHSQVQTSVMGRFFYYQLANIYVSMGVGSISSSIQVVLQQPHMLLRIFGESLPTLSLYFATVMVVKTLTALPVEMLRVWTVAFVLPMRLCSNKKKCTRRELRSGVFGDAPMLYGHIYPHVMMVLMIVVTYSTMAPLLMPFGVAYFGGAYIMYKYQFLYVYVNDYQSGGDMWYATFDRTLVILIGAVIIFIGYVAIRTEAEAFDNGYIPEFKFGPFWFTIPLPFMISFFWRSCHETFMIPSQSLSIDSAVKIDAAHKARAPEKNFSDKCYRQPDLAEPQLRPEPYRRKRHYMGSSMPKKRWIPTTDAPDKDVELKTIHDNSSLTTRVVDRILWRDRALSESHYDNDLFTHSEIKEDVLREGTMRQDGWYAFKDYREAEDEYETDQYDNCDLLSDDGSSNESQEDEEKKFARAQQFLQTDLYEDDDHIALPMSRLQSANRTPTDIEQGYASAAQSLSAGLRLNIPKEASRRPTGDPSEKVIDILSERPTVSSRLSMTVDSIVTRTRNLSFSGSPMDISRSQTAAGGKRTLKIPSKLKTLATKAQTQTRAEMDTNVRSLEMGNMGSTGAKSSTKQRLPVSIFNEAAPPPPPRARARKPPPSCSQPAGSSPLKTSPERAATKPSVSHGNASQPPDKKGSAKDKKGPPPSESQSMWL
jgi:hypothetical protein